MSDKYILRGHTPVPAHLLEWATWFETSDDERQVALTDLGGGVDVSTVFVGIDYQFGNGPPLLFETMICGGAMDGEYERYTTWDEAEAGHARMVERIRATATAASSTARGEGEAG